MDNLSSHRRGFMHETISEELDSLADERMHEKEIGILRSSRDISDIENGHDLVVSSAIKPVKKINDCDPETIIAASEENIDDQEVSENLTGDGNRVCRICLSCSKFTFSMSSAVSASSLVQLGCSCKGDLGLVHVDCAQIWFEMKGNRKCEICGDTATNILGVVHGTTADDNQTTDAVDAIDTTVGRDVSDILLKVLFGCLFLLPV